MTERKGRCFALLLLIEIEHSGDRFCFFRSHGTDKSDGMTPVPISIRASRLNVDKALTL